MLRVSAALLAARRPRPPSRSEGGEEGPPMSGGAYFSADHADFSRALHIASGRGSRKFPAIVAKPTAPSPASARLDQLVGPSRARRLPPRADEELQRAAARRERKSTSGSDVGASPWRPLPRGLVEVVATKGLVDKGADGKFNYAFPRSRRRRRSLRRKSRRKRRCPGDP